jgi:serine/threonine protein kinase
MSDAAVREDISLESLVAQVVDEFRERQKRGERPSAAEYTARYPQAAELLRKVLAALELVETSLVGPLALGDGSSDAPQTGILGDFRLLREAGKGGMGIVYEAEQISLGRHVALKVLPLAATLDPRQLQRFHNEARAAACLHHTNIVPVFGVGCERGVHYYAMQFIDGQSLAAFLDAQRGGGAASTDQPTTDFAPAPAGPAAATTVQAAACTLRAPRDRAYFRRVAEWGIQAAEALDHAHQLGIIHRDIKPANLLVDAADRLWVTDFGLAQIQSDTRLTMTGDLVGTLRYMSPEQALAKRVAIDHRTDVYSLGATLYEVLALRPAFDGADRQELLRQIAFDEPERPRRLNNAIPVELETIVLKALEKNPAERYATAKDLADDLRRYQEDRPIQARRPTLGQRATKWVRRHRALVRSAFLLVLLAAVGCGIGAWFLWQEQQETLHQKNAAEKRLAQLEKANDILASVFRDLHPDEEKKGGPALRVQLGERLNHAAKLLEGDAVGDPLVVARLQDQLGESLYGLGHHEKALALFEKAHQTRATLLGPDQLDALSSKEKLAMALHKARGQYDRPEQLLREVLDARTTRLGPDNPEALRCKGNLAAVHCARGDYDRAESLYRELLQTQKDKLGDADMATLASKNNLASVYLMQGNYGQAEPLLREVVRGYRAKLGDEDGDTLVSKSNLAMVYVSQTKYEPAEALLKEVFQTRMAKLGAKHPATLLSKQQLASLYKARRQYDQAEALLQETIQGFAYTSGHEHPDTLSCKEQLADLYAAEGKYDRAEPLCEEVVQARKALLGPAVPDTLRAKHELAVVYWRRHKLDQSVPLFEDVLRGRQAVLGVDNAETILAALNLAANHRDAGRLTAAVELLDSWLPRARTVLPPTSSHRDFGCRFGAETYARAGRHAKAEPLLRELAEAVRQQAGAGSRAYAVRLGMLGENLLVQQKYADAEPLLRQVLAWAERKVPDDWRTFNIRSLLGGALLGQKKYAEAAPLLLQGFDGMKQRPDKIPPDAKFCVIQALERLVQLYEATGEKEEAEKWRKELKAVRGKAEAPAGPSPSK